LCAEEWRFQIRIEERPDSSVVNNTGRRKFAAQFTKYPAANCFAASSTALDVGNPGQIAAIACPGRPNFSISARRRASPADERSELQRPRFSASRNAPHGQAFAAPVTKPRAAQRFSICYRFHIFDPETVAHSCRQASCSSLLFGVFFRED